MSKKLTRHSLRISLLSLAALAIVGGAGFTRAQSPEVVKPKGETFLIGTDAPLASVASFSVQIQAINAIAADGTSVPLLSSPATVDFARFNGLETLLDINDVPVGSYPKVSITLGTATLGYLSVQPGVAPSIQTMAATLSNSTIVHTLARPLNVTTTEPVGVRIDFDLHKSIQVNATTHQITGIVNPVFNITVVRPRDPGAYIDEFDAAVLSVDVGAQTFIIQGPHGRHWTIDVTGTTEWDGGAALASLNTSSIVQISGWLDPANSTITADEVNLLSGSGFYAAGQATWVTPASGAATSFDLYVRALLPSTTGIALGQIATIDLAGKEKFYIHWAHNPLTQFVFNPSALLPGQSISVGGPATGAANAAAVNVRRVNLRSWGFIGKVVKGSVKVSMDTFQLNVNGFAGQLIPQTVNVYLTGRTEYRYGYTGIHEIAGGDSVRVVGLLLKNPANGNTILIGKYVDALD